MQIGGKEESKGLGKQEVREYWHQSVLFHIKMLIVEIT